MNGIEIEAILKSNKRTSKIFKGVFPSDEIPKQKITYPSAFIVNTDEKNKPGEHWVAFYFSSKNRLPEYFDSYGFFPLKLSFYKFLPKKKFKYSSLMLQDIFSTACGYYVIYFIVHKIYGFSMKNILSVFDNNTLYNDQIVINFVKDFYKQNLCKSKQIYYK